MLWSLAAKCNMIINKQTLPYRLKQHCPHLEQFYEYNPSVGFDCSGLWPSSQLLSTSHSELTLTPIRLLILRPHLSFVDPSALSLLSATLVQSTTPPGPTQTGQLENCNTWHTVQCMLPTPLSALTNSLRSR
jgi:hypothetical protein